MCDGASFWFGRYRSLVSPRLARLWVPFVGSMNPSERAKALGAPIRVDVSGIVAGRQMTVAWRGKPVWILHRTPDMIERLRRRDTLALLVDPQSAVRGQQPEFARNLLRSIRIHPAEHA